MNPFSPPSSDDTSDEHFDELETFEAEHLPEPGPFLAEHDILEDADHVVFHRLTHALFDERGVYDVTFGYNLAELNLDRRHPEAGFRYAVDADESSQLRAEFTPSTEFCPQAEILATGAFRAWNGLIDRHEYDIVRVRLDSDHHQADQVNETLENLEETVLETGEIGDTTSHSSTSGPS